MKSPVVWNSGDAAFAREKLLDWFKTEARTFPWRYKSDPYAVLIAEMMLRRTQARQVVPVYELFLQDYPNVESLSSAPVEQVRQHLQPLGLAWRAANFEKVAKEVVQRHGGKIPVNREELLALTGVGPYVADAVRIFAFGEAAVLVDTNTVRVAARYFGFEYDQESRRRPEVIEAVSQLVDPNHAAASNYALLDFAATICQAKKPLHDKCPLIEHCAFYRRNQQTTSDGTDQSEELKRG